MCAKFSDYHAPAPTRSKTEIFFSLQHFILNTFPTNRTNKWFFKLCLISFGSREVYATESALSSMVTLM